MLHRLRTCQRYEANHIPDQSSENQHFLSQCILWFKTKATALLCHWNNAATSPQRLSDLVRCCFFLYNNSLALGFCPRCGGLASIQLLLCEWQLIKALSFCWRHHHYVIPLQGSVLLAMKPTVTRALKTQAQTLAKLPSSSRDISSDILLTETIVTNHMIFIVLHQLPCIYHHQHWDKAGSCIKYSHPNYEGPH